MHNTIRLFDVELFTPFGFKQSLVNIYQHSVAKETTMCVKDNYFVSPFAVTAKYNILHDESILKQQGVVIGNVESDSQATAQVNEKFIHYLIKHELIWLQYFLNTIVNHLSTREIGSGKLIHCSYIVDLIGRAVQHLTEIENALINNHQLSDGIFNHVAKTIQYIGSILAKLAGGRAFLQGSVMDMLSTFSIINSIYLT